MATTVQLKGTIRHERGKGSARKLRRARRIPGVLYGKGRKPVNLELDEREFVSVVAGHSASNLIVDLVVSEGEVAKTLIREIQVDPVSGSILHIDLNQISLTEMIEVDVPVDLEGVPVGVKNAGGILQHPIRTITLRCLPHNIPDRITVDVSGLEIGDSIHVQDLNLTDVEVQTDADSLLASVVQPAKVEEPTEAEEVVEEAGEPEVVGKKKEEEGEAESKEEKRK